MSIIFSRLILSSAVWLQWWVNANENDPNGRVGYWLGIFATFSCIAIVANIISDWYAYVAFKMMNVS